jgi:histone H4
MGPPKSVKRRKQAVNWDNSKRKKKPKVAEKAAVVKAAEKAAAADTEDDVPPPPAVPVAPSVTGGAVVADVVAAPPSVDDNGADAPVSGTDPASSVPAAASVGVTLTSPASVDDTPRGGVGGVGVGLDSQVAGDDVGSSMQVVEGSLGSVDLSQVAAVSSSVQPAPSRFTKQKSVPRLIVNPTPPTDSASKSPDLGSSAGPLVSPVHGSDRPRIGGKSVGGKRLANLTTLRMLPQSSDDEEENEDEEAADVPCSSTSTKVATSTTEKTKVAPVITKQKGKDKAKQPGGSKRHAKVAKPVLEGITKNDIGRIAKRAGVTRIGGGVYDELRFQAQEYLDDILTKTLIHTDYRKAQTVTTGDVLQGFKCVGGGAFYD